MANRCFDSQLTADADLTIASGRSAGAQYHGGPLLLSRNDPSLDIVGDSLDWTSDLYGYDVALLPGGSGNYQFDGLFLMPPGARARDGCGRFALAALQAAGAQPVGQGGVDAIGFWDPRRQVLGFGRLTAREQVMAALDELNAIYHVPVSHDDAITRRYLSDTGELQRDSAKGRLTIDAPRLAAVAGDLRGGPFTLGPLTIDTLSAAGVVLVTSLDGRPLAETQRFMVKMVANPVNSAMTVSAPGPQNDPSDRWIVGYGGGPPVRTGGRPAAGGWRLGRNGLPWLSVDQIDGVCELSHDLDGWRWFTDTPDVHVNLPGAERAWAVAADGRESELPAGLNGWTLPPEAVMARAR